MTDELMQAICDVRDRRVERASKPGYWRVFRVGDVVHMEMWTT